MKIIIVIITSLFLSNCIMAQTNNTDYTLTTEIGAGYSFYLTDMDYNDLNKNGFAGTLRFMWNPEHLLSIGLESGYEHLYSIRVEDYNTEFGDSRFSASMVAVPIYIAFAMKITDRIKILGGSGTYFLFNRGELFGDELKSSLISIGLYTGLSYTYPLNKDFSLGGEIKYSYIAKIQDQTLSFQAIFMYNLVRW
jgi:hypothetical protein